MNNKKLYKYFATVALNDNGDYEYSFGSKEIPYSLVQENPNNYMVASDGWLVERIDKGVMQKQIKGGYQVYMVAYENKAEEAEPILQRALHSLILNQIELHKVMLDTLNNFH